MSEIRIIDNDELGRDELVELYDAVGWSLYTRDPDKLVRAIEASRFVVSARDEDDRLVGLARIVGDGETIAYLQDILVHPDHQRTGIGRQLIEAAFGPFAHVRQHVLITDLEDRQQSFYEAVGMVEGGSAKVRTFVRFGD